MNTPLEPYYSEYLAALREGSVTGVRIVSEQGLDCAVQNPWPGRPVRIVRSGWLARDETASGARFTFPTRAGETVELRPLPVK